MTAEELDFTDRHGVEVFYRRWRAADPKGAVVIAHGASEHGGRYGRFAAALTAAGYEAFALDHRGHGRTGAVTGAGQLGPGGAGALLEDLGQLIDIAGGAVGGRPVILFGHSMGSMIAQAYATAGAAGVDGYVLSGPPGVVDGAAEMAAGLREAAEGGMAGEPIDLLGGYNTAFEPARTPYDWLSRDPAEVDAYVSDPLCGDGNPLTYGFVAGLFELSVPSAEPAALGGIPSIPVMIIAGEADPVGANGDNVRKLEQRLRDVGLDVTARYWPGARHELLNEANRDEVTSEVISWLDAVVSRPS